MLRTYRGISRRARIRCASRGNYQYYFGIGVSTPLPVSLDSASANLRYHEHLFQLRVALAYCRLKGHPPRAIVRNLIRRQLSSFLFTRVINMPCFLYVMATNSYGNGLGWYKLFFVPLALLQWFWFFKIASTTIKRLRPTKDEKSKC